jgi:hypothetical protein
LDNLPAIYKSKLTNHTKNQNQWHEAMITCEVTHQTKGMGILVNIFTMHTISGAKWLVQMQVYKKLVNF